MEERSVWHFMVCTLLTLLILNGNAEILLHKMELNITLQTENKQSIMEALDTWLLPSSLATVKEVTIRSYYFSSYYCHVHKVFYMEESQLKD